MREICGRQLSSIPKNAGGHYQSIIWNVGKRRIVAWVLQRHGRPTSVEIYHYKDSLRDVDLLGRWVGLDVFTAHCVVLYLLHEYPEGNDHGI